MAIVSRVRLFQDGLARLLADRRPGFVVTTAVPDSCLASRLGALKPDVLLVDVALMRDSELATRLRASVPGARIVALAVDDEHVQDVLMCAEAGVSGLVSQAASVDDLITGVEFALRGELSCSPRVTALLWTHLGNAAQSGASLSEELTGREHQILGLVSEALSNKEISQRLGIEVSTVKNHVHNILDKLRVQHRWQAASVARRFAIQRPH